MCLIRGKARCGFKSNSLSKVRREIEAPPGKITLVAVAVDAEDFNICRKKARARAKKNNLFIAVLRNYARRNFLLLLYLRENTKK